MALSHDIIVFKKIMDKHYPTIPINYSFDSIREYAGYIGYPIDEIPNTIGSFLRTYVTIEYHERFHRDIQKIIKFCDIEFNSMSHTLNMNLIRCTIEIIESCS